MLVIVVIPRYLYLYFPNIYVLCVFTEKPYSKPLEHNVVYIPICTFLLYLLKSPIVNHWNVMYLHSNINIEPRDHDFLQADRTSALFRS